MANAQTQQQNEVKVVGRWYPTTNGELHQWEAVCGRCGAVVPAVKLKLTRLPFGRGEMWACCK